MGHILFNKKNATQMDEAIFDTFWEIIKSIFEYTYSPKKLPKHNIKEILQAIWVSMA